jgi:hypothetical protein
MARVHDALATVDGLAAWWTNDTTGDPEVGGTLVFAFGDRGRIVFEVVEDAPDRIRWRGLPDGPDEWVDTTVTFELEQEGDETVVLFTHAGWREPVPFMHHCSTKWAAFLLSLKAVLEGGAGAPYPGDVHISSWD